MTKKLFQSQLARAATGRLQLEFDNKVTKAFIFLVILFLPVQLGKHFWPEFSYVLGERIDYLSPTIYFTDILIFLLFVFKAFQRKIYVSNKIFLSLFLFLPSIIFSANIYISIYSFVKILEYLFLFSIFVSSGQRLSKLFLTGFGIGIIGETTIALFQFLKQGSIGGLLYFLGERTFSGATPDIANASINGQLILRPYATFPHPNVLAGFLFVVMLLCLHFSRLEREKSWKIITTVIIIFGTIGIFLTLSRTAILVWIMCLIATAWRGVKTYSKKIKLGFMLFCVGMSIALIITFPDILGRFKSLSFGDESIVQREVLSNASLSMFLKSPIFGIGLGSFVSALPSFESFDNLLFTIQPVHNIFLLVLSETGTLGLLIFAVVLGQTLGRIIKTFGNNFYLFLAFFGIMFIGLFDHYFLTLEQGQLLFTLFLAICFRETQKLLK